MKLLVVDDNVEIVRLLSSILDLSGHEVGSAYNGMEAIEWLQNNSCDAVITDAKMPKLGGVEVCQFIKLQHPEIYIIGISGSPEALRELANAGADVCFPKPFHIDDIDKAIERRFYSSGTACGFSAGISAQHRL
jgi:DNA-binding response OmpR family regulator